MGYRAVPISDQDSGYGSHVHGVFPGDPSFIGGCISLILFDSLCSFPGIQQKFVLLVTMAPNAVDNATLQDTETGKGDQVDLKDLVEVVEDATDAIDPAAEKRLLRKIDLRLIPILFVLYLCAFIDR